MIFILSLISLTFSLIGFIIGLCADGYERLQIFPFLIITPMTFLGGCFYSIKMLPEFWQKVSMFNPVVYLINIFRWSFYGISDVNITLSISIIFIFLFVCISIIAWIFKTGYGLKNQLKQIINKVYIIKEKSENLKNFINNLYIFCKNYKIRDYEKDLISINYRIRNFSLIIEDFSKIIGNELQRKFIDSCEFFTEINNLFLGKPKN